MKKFESLEEVMLYCADIFETEDTEKIFKITGYKSSKCKQFVGICSLYEKLVSERMKKSFYEKHMWDILHIFLNDAFLHLYGNDNDPFLKFGKSYFNTEIDWKFRAEKCREIAAYFKERSL